MFPSEGVAAFPFLTGPFQNDSCFACAGRSAIVFFEGVASFPGDSGDDLRIGVGVPSRVATAATPDPFGLATGDFASTAPGGVFEASCRAANGIASLSPPEKSLGIDPRREIFA